jgi:hypothetical protein
MEPAWRRAWESSPHHLTLTLITATVIPSLSHPPSPSVTIITLINPSPPTLLTPHRYGHPGLWKGETGWDDAPIDELPAPFPTLCCLPFHRGSIRRLLRDNTHLTNSLR